MTRKLIATLGWLAVMLPAQAQEAAPYQEGGSWNEPPPPAPEGYGAYTGDAQNSVDVSVDLAAPGASVTFESFHDGLAPYGQWMTVARYGRVWRPVHVAAGWRPYYYGRWEWTDEGWLWVSDEPWGWAAYHYGRWAYDPSYGWVWIPGYQWAPAWVSWRYGPEYIGWAPLGPGFSVYVTSYPVVYGWWTFVPCRRFAGVPVYSVAFTGSHVRGIFHGTQPAPPRAFVYGARAPAWGGPARPFVEQRIGRPIAPVRVQPVASASAAVASAARPGIVPVYRPEARLPTARVAPAPAQAPARGVAPASPPAAGAFQGSAAGGGRPTTIAPRQAQPSGPAPARPQATYAPAPARPPQGVYAPMSGRSPQGSYAPRAPRGGAAAQGGGVAPRPQDGAPTRQGGGHAATPAPAEHHREH